MPTAKPLTQSSAFALDFDSQVLDSDLARQNEQLAAALHDLFLRTEALRKFEDPEVLKQQPHEHRTAQYFAAIARSNARNVLRDLGLAS